MASRSHRRPSSIDASSSWVKQGHFPDSHLHSHERRPSLPLATQRRMGLPSLPPRHDVTSQAETERVPRRRRSNSMISPTSALADVGDLWSTRENPVMYIKASSHLGLQYVSTSCVLFFGSHERPFALAENQNGSQSRLQTSRPLWRTLMPLPQLHPYQTIISSTVPVKIA